MPLANEDNLRLNVLMAQNVKAIRIDEGKMIVYALTAKGEAKIHLNPNVKNERYITQIKEFLSTKVLGAPGGFPLYISRWNRMGEARSVNLDKLLLLGENEALNAVVNSRGLTPELARSAWWVSQSANNARSMLSQPAVAKSDVGKLLANFLIEFLPFEEDPSKMLASLRLVLQPGLISETEKMALWNKAKSKNILYVGFLDVLPDELPEQVGEHELYSKIKEVLAQLLAVENPYAVILSKLLSSAGQTFLHTAETAFKRPPNQEAIAALIEAIRRYVYTNQPEAGQTVSNYSLGLRKDGQVEVNMQNIIDQAEALCDLSQEVLRSPELLAILNAAPQLKEQIVAILALSRTTQAVTFPVFSKTTAIGTLMRKKLKPVIDPMLDQIRVLRYLSI